MKPATAKQTTSRTAATNPIEKNYVHDNIIRAENIKKENFFHQRNRNESYQLNPYNFYPHYEKPTKVNPWYLKQREEELKRQISVPIKEDTYLECYTDDPILESISTSNVLKTLKNPSLVPRQLSSRPVTANQEIGWYAQNYNTYKQRLNYGAKSDDLTKWNGSYCVDHGINPFKVKNRDPIKVDKTAPPPPPPAPSKTPKA